MAQQVTVVFRNTTGMPVQLVIYGQNGSGSSDQLYSGTVSGASGIFSLASGYASYSASAEAPRVSGYGTQMQLPVIRRNTNVSVVFQAVPGVQE